MNCSPETPLLIRMNRGKLTQVFGDIILNSECWLKREITLGRMDSGEVRMARICAGCDF